MLIFDADGYRILFQNEGTTRIPDCPEKWNQPLIELYMIERILEIIVIQKRQENILIF